VRSRLLVGGVAWLAATGVFLAALQWPVQARRLRHRPTSALARTLDQAAGDSHRRRPQWAVVSAQSALHLLVVNVEAADARQSQAIARQIVGPVRGKYDEILIYVRQAGAADALAARRVQWTPRGGFAEMVIH
jgi:hypothetical protein